MLWACSLRQVLMMSYCAVVLGCGPIGERNTAGTLFIQLQHSDTADPTPHEDVLLFERLGLNSGQDPGIPSQSHA